MSIYPLNLKLKTLIVKLLRTKFVQYHQAVRIGQERARKSQLTIFSHAGFAMLTHTVKKSQGTFVPVGEKELVSIVQKSEGWIGVIVDEEGFAKSYSKALSEAEASDILR